MIRLSNLFKAAFSNISILFLGGALSAISILLTQIILARTLSPSGYGMFSAALASVTLLAPLAVFGIQHSWLKLYGAEGVGAKRWLVPSRNFLAASFFITLTLLLSWSFIGPHSTDFRILLIGLLPLVLSHIFLELVNAKFQLEEKYLSLAGWQALPHFLRLIFVSLYMLSFFGLPNIQHIVLCYSVISLVISLFGLFFLTGMFKGSLSIKNTNQLQIEDKLERNLTTLDIARHAWPYGLAAVFYLSYMQSDLILLKYLIGNKEAGIYSAAFAILISSYQIPGVIYQKFLLPKLHRWANEDELKLLKVFQAGNGIMLFLGFLFFLILATLVPIVVPIFFGNEYLETVRVLQILVFCIPLRFLSTSIEAPLFTKNLMPINTSIWGAAAFLNLILNFLLIPMYSIYGAAVATLISEIFLLLLNLFFVTKKLYGTKTFLYWGQGFKSSFWDNT